MIRNCFRSFSEMTAKRGSLELPLLVVLFLPFYSMPEAGDAIRILQMQFFQVAAVLCLAFCKFRFSSSLWHPLRWFVFFCLLQLAIFPMSDRILMTVQMVIIGYVFFECAVSSRIEIKGFRWTIALLLIATALYSVKQRFGISGYLPDYLCLDRSILNDKIMFVAGIWTVQAYCGAFLAICICSFWTFRSLWKWLILAVSFFLMYQTHSSFAWGGMILGVLWIEGLKKFELIKKYKFLLIIAPMIFGAFVLYHFTLGYGDGTSERLRLMVWTLTFKKAIASGLWGNGFGSFLQFGFEQTFSKTNTANSFFAQAHFELLQLWFEAGYAGLLVGVGIIARVIFIGLKKRRNNFAVSLSGGLISIIAISFGQPVFHMVNITTLTLLMLGLLEREGMKNDY